MINVTKTELPPLDEYAEYLKHIWQSGWITNDGELLRLLQQRLQEHLDVKHLIVVSNGTVALHCALRAARVTGEIVTTPFTFAATTNAILWANTVPIFADIDPDTFNIDPHEVERCITDKTSAILAVHVYGNPCYVEDLQEIAKNHGLRLIFDAAHAFGVEHNKRSVLTSGDISTLSFHATKVYHTGEGGAIVSDDERIADELLLMRNHGIKSEQEVLLPGTNAKMSELHAAMGLCNLERIDDYIERKKAIYKRYTKGLNSTHVRFQKIIASKYNYSYMPVCFEDSEMRERVYQGLLEIGVKPRRYFYPLTVDYAYLKHDRPHAARRSALPHAIDVANRVLCLPSYPSLEMGTVDTITDRTNSILEEDG
ncbi:MAG: DegT/DnrJ/EryC1/StrS family aminotransferase [Halobacteriota archaeon]